MAHVAVRHGDHVRLGIGETAHHAYIDAMNRHGLRMAHMADFNYIACKTTAEVERERAKVENKSA